MKDHISVCSRRAWMQRVGGVGGVSLLGGASPWFRALAGEAANHPTGKRACILLWMGGGPSQLETLDPKPGHRNGGPTKAIATSVAGIQIAEHLPQVARQMSRLALVRAMSTKEGDHQRASFAAHTGRVPQGPIAYPTLGAIASKELGSPEDLPKFVSIGAQQFFGDSLSSGFLGPAFAPLEVGGGGYYPAPDGSELQNALSVANLQPRGDDRFQQRWELLQLQQQEFAAQRTDRIVQSHQATLERARLMMDGRASKLFDLDDEPDKLKQSYGPGLFGQGCLLARRLVEAGVPFVEVSLDGWDTHTDNFNQTQQLCAQLDPAWATLLSDLQDRGLLESTLVVWMGEFGRTPIINRSQGRDHYPNAWSSAIAGAGIEGGRVLGDTGKDGREVEGDRVSAPQWIATICSRLGLDLTKQNMSNVGRPIRLVDPGVSPVKELS